ncbi:hypothetical protein KSP39_PZI004141 [Platanthera zijinensis]|uniref:Uncharacterized protein n=1 Tax=Platanthera zijinensis TaxID=2320716 RepID=A0AAP0GDG4_9ASPA
MEVAAQQMVPGLDMEVQHMTMEELESFHNTLEELRRNVASRQEELEMLSAVEAKPIRGGPGACLVMGLAISAACIMGCICLPAAPVVRAGHACAEAVALAGAPPARAGRVRAGHARAGCPRADQFRDWCDVRFDGGERIEVRSNKVWLEFESHQAPATVRPGKQLAGDLAAGDGRKRPCKFHGLGCPCMHCMGKKYSSRWIKL